MARPTEVLEQLLSAQLAQALDAVGRSAWESLSRVFGAMTSSTASLASTDARLVMPDEILDEFNEPHVAIPLILTNATAQETTSWLVLGYADVVAFLASTGTAGSDVLDSAAAMASRLAEAVNAATFSARPGGLGLAVGAGSTDTMVATLGAMDEPCILLDADVEAGAHLPVRLVLAGTLLEMLSSAAAAGDFAAAAPPAPATESPGELTEASPPVTPAGATAAPAREPTPITTAPTARRAQFSPLPDNGSRQQPANIELLSDLQMAVSVELGRTEMSVSDVLRLGTGSVIELDRLAGEPVDILVNDRLIARGEVVVVDENFGVRILEVLPRSREIGKTG